MKSERLRVEHSGHLVGWLTRDANGSCTFRYAQDWLDDKGAFALASSLPLGQAPYPSAFFENLLPEGGARRRIAQANGVSVDNDFELLRLLGRECAGALEIFAPEDAAAEVGARLLMLDEQDAEALASASGFATYFRGSRRARLSLAGAQNKLAVVRTDEGLGIPLDGSPTTHVLKLPNPEFRGLVENEALMSAVARSVGLPTVETEVHVLGKVRLLLVRRYDREVDANGTVRRIHQQDFCQALGLPPERKYESEGGPTLAQLFEVARSTVSDPLSVSLTLLRWVLLNVLIHNADAHAKNLSLVTRRDGSCALAPLYDLVCTGAYPQLDPLMASSIGGTRDAGNLTSKHWNALASDLGIGKRLVHQSLQELGDRVPEQFDRSVAELQPTIGRIPRLAELTKTVRKRAKRVVQGRLR